MTTGPGDTGKLETGQSNINAGDREVLGTLVFYKGIARSAAALGESKRMEQAEITARLRRLRRMGLARYFPGEHKQAGLWQATLEGVEAIR